MRAGGLGVLSGVRFALPRCAFTISIRQKLVKMGLPLSKMRCSDVSQIAPMLASVARHSKRTSTGYTCEYILFEVSLFVIVYVVCMGVQ